MHDRFQLMWMQLELPASSPRPPAHVLAALPTTYSQHREPADPLHFHDHTLSSRTFQTSANLQKQACQGTCGKNNFKQQNSSPSCPSSPLDCAHLPSDNPRQMRPLWSREPGALTLHGFSWFREQGMSKEVDEVDEGEPAVPEGTGWERRGR